MNVSLMLLRHTFAALSTRLVVIDGTACTNEVFGDPAPDVAKSCSLPLTGA